MAKGSFLKSITRALKSVGLRRCATKRRSKKAGNRSRKSQKSQKSQRNQRQGGGGYSETLNLSIYPGQQVHSAYTGSGYDCAGSPQRAGALDSIGMLQNPGGLPGLSPSLMRGGGTQLGSGGIVVGNDGEPVIGGRRRRRRNQKQQQQQQQQQQQGGTVLGVAVQDGSYPGTPASGTPAQAMPQESTVPANVNAARAQAGGRYGMEGSPLSPSNGVGMSGYAQIGRVGCEPGSLDALNPDQALQSMTTNRMTYNVPGFTQVMRGGRRHPHKRLGYMKKTTQKKKAARKQQGGVVVGQVDAMRYYAPTAGYENLPLMPQVPNNPGILMQLGYPAGHFNPACLKTN